MEHPELFNRLMERLAAVEAALGDRKTRSVHKRNSLYLEKGVLNADLVKLTRWMPEEPFDEDLPHILQQCDLSKYRTDMPRGWMWTHMSNMMSGLGWGA